MFSWNVGGCIKILENVLFYKLGLITLKIWTVLLMNAQSLKLFFFASWVSKMHLFIPKLRQETETTRKRYVSAGLF